MADTVSSFQDLSKLRPGIAAEPEVEVAQPKIDKFGRAYAAGRRRVSCTVWVKPGGGRFTVNGKAMPAYFARPTQRW